MTEYEETICTFITGTALSQFKGYYEMDLVNEFDKTRYVFHIPRELFDMMIFTKRKVKQDVCRTQSLKKKEILTMIS